MDVIQETNYQFPQQTNFHRGKVRDVYAINNQYLVVVATDRISAFDIILPEAIPYKGQVLNQIAAHFLKSTQGIVPNWVLGVPDPNVTIGKICKPFPIEIVVRAYLSGHAWRTYQAGKRELCGVSLPNGLKENQRLPHPIITPTTKSNVGHDEDISAEEIIKRGLASEEEYQKMEVYAYKLFQHGMETSAKHGLILVDTKYEFGKANGEILLIDEVHTPDSSRYFYRDGYEELQLENKAQRQLSKEFVRKWLIENGFQGKEDQVMPILSPALIEAISNRYVELYEQLMGETFQKASYEDALERIEKNILASLKCLENDLT